MDEFEPVPFDHDLLRLVQEGEMRAASTFLVVLEPGSAPPHAYDLIERGRSMGVEFELSDEGAEGGIALEAPGLGLVLHAVDLDATAFSGRWLGSEDSARLTECTAGATLRLTLDEPVLEEFHTALRAIVALFPEVHAVRDIDSLTWLMRDWILGATASQAPPPPSTLFTIHAVHGGSRTWLHTHGLLRCGAIELEVLEDLDAEETSAVSQLLSAASNRFIDHGPPPAGEPFLVGRDMEVVWLPWDEALRMRRARPGELGGLDDRADHGGLVGTLLVRRERKGLLGRRRVHYGSVAEYVPIIEDNPVFFVSSMETQRMAMLASEHYPLFRKLHRRLRREAGWRFLVKLGYEVDDGGGESEHLWFDVHAARGAEVDATLMNEPYGIARMHSGERGWHAIDQLSDWRIIGAKGTFGPDGVPALLEAVESEPPR